MTGNSYRAFEVDINSRAHIASLNRFALAQQATHVTWPFSKNRPKPWQG